MRIFDNDGFPPRALHAIVAKTIAIMGDKKDILVVFKIHLLTKIQRIKYR